ncbi:MAG TPA: YigZ family protein [bacterium]|nr:YigZ family protein [bacterium]HPG45934.1 YigZ family protein [bacterium]HPM97756.1 YigZ family protein [bacterium]
MALRYRTLQSAVSAEQKIKGSRFIARAVPLATREAAEAEIELVRAQNADATHNCYAYRIGMAEKEVTRCSDDGEPSGTAGKPILQAIIARDLTQVLIVVTRYFGGTKLGTGGLIRAYSGVAFAALDQGVLIDYYEPISVLLVYSYEYSQSLFALLHKFDASIIEAEYGGQIRQTVRLRKEKAVAFRQALLDATAGQIVFRLLDNPS